MGFKLSERSLKRLEGVHPDLILIITEAIKITPIDFGIPRDGGVRSEKRQKELFDQKVSKCDGFHFVSRHQLSTAFDFYAYVSGNASWRKHYLGMLYGVFHATAVRLFNEKKITSKILWGGTFGSDTFDGWDMGHIEIDVDQ